MFSWIRDRRLLEGCGKIAKKSYELNGHVIIQSDYVSCSGTRAVSPLDHCLFLEYMFSKSSLCDIRGSGKRTGIPLIALIIFSQCKTLGTNMEYNGL